MKWETKRLKLTKDQRARGVIFSSALIVTNREIETTIHEVLATDPDAERKITNLRDVDFFKGLAAEFGFDVIHEMRI